MTEAEWRACSSAGWIMVFLKGKASDRKLRLFACSCTRRIWSHLVDERSHRAVEIAECFADGKVSAGDLHGAHAVAIGAAGANILPDTDPTISDNWHSDPLIIASYVAVSASAPSAYPGPGGYAVVHASDGARQAIAHAAGRGVHDGNRTHNAAEEAESRAQCHLLRDIFGNPFRPVTFASEWRTDTVLALAAQMYESRDFSAMPILADALQDAECDNADVLDHCRSDGPHVRGCWVVDLVLGLS